MAGVMTPYIVRQGDYLAKLAFVRGFDADEVWNDPKNEDLRKLRSDPNILAPGDIVYLPEKMEGEGLPIEKGTENNYAATVPKISFSIRLQDSDNSPIANRKYWIEGLGEPLEGTTDAEGKVSFEVPLVVRELQLSLEGDMVIRRILIGDLDPHDESSGAKQRLAACGFGAATTTPSTTAASAEDELAMRIQAFQFAHHLDTTGNLDTATSTALRDMFGC